MAIDTLTETGTWVTKSGLAQMLKGGVIMDVVTADQARIAEDSGACAVMALERVPSDIRQAGGVARMADPTKIIEIKEAVTIPVMAKCRIGHFVEAQILEALKVDYIDESEVLTPADENNHVDKHGFTVPFVCGARDLGEALRRIGEGAAMIRTKGEAGTGNIVEAVRHARTVLGEIRRIQNMTEDELMATAQGPPGPLRPRQGGPRHGAAPGSELRRRRHCESRRRRPDDAVGSRWRIRRFRHLQVAAAGAHVRGHRQGHYELQQPRCPRGSLARPRRRHARPRRSYHARRGAAGSQRLVGLTRVGVLAIQGDFLEHRLMIESLGVDAPEVRLGKDFAGLDGLVIPGGESTTIVQLLDIFDMRNTVVGLVREGCPCGAPAPA